MKYKKFFYNKILKKTYLSFIVIITCVLIIDLSLTIKYSIFSLNKVSSDQNLKEKQSINSELLKYKKLVESIALDPQFSNPKESVVSRSQRLIPYQKTFDLEIMGISDETGYLSSTYDRTTGTIGDREYFKNTLLKKQTIISPLIYAKANGQRIYVVCTPIFNKSKNVVGTVHGSIKFNTIKNIIALENKNLYSIMIDENQKIIAHSFDKKALDLDIFQFPEKIFFTEKKFIIDNFKNKIPGTYYSFSFSRKTFYKTTYDFIKDTNWILLTRLDIFKSLYYVFFIWFMRVSFIICLLILVDKYYKRFLLKNIVVVDKFIETVATVESSKKLVLDEIFKQSLLGFKDPMTNTLRKESFFNTVTNLLNKEDKSRGKSIFLFIDLDYLKNINDSLGHEYGDLAIRNFSEKIIEYFKEFKNFKIARYGGDEFIAFIPNLTKKQLDKISKDLNKYLLGEIIKDQKSFKYSASIGISIYGEDSLNLKELITFADEAVYESKRKGRNTISFYKEIKKH